MVRLFRINLISISKLIALFFISSVFSSQLSVDVENHKIVVSDSIFYDDIDSLKAKITFYNDSKALVSHTQIPIINLENYTNELNVAVPKGYSVLTPKLEFESFANSQKRILQISPSPLVIEDMGSSIGIGKSVDVNLNIE